MENIAIAITTCNRNDVLQQSLEMMWKHTPKEVPVYIVDDASDEPPASSSFRFQSRVGISKAKNKCLELLMQTSKTVQHFFLFDNDTHPIADNWYIPYVESPIKHLCYTFYSKGDRNKVLNHAVHRQGNGCMLYVHRSVVEAIGGFDTDFYNKYEHSEYSRRAYNAGLIPHPFIDVIGSDKLLYCRDQERSFTRYNTTEPLEVTSKYLNEQAKLFSKKQHDKHFKEYR